MTWNHGFGIVATTADRIKVSDLLGKLVQNENFSLVIGFTAVFMVAYLWYSLHATAPDVYFSYPEFNKKAVVQRI
jgi:hypothetical protein